MIYFGIILFDFVSKQKTKYGCVFQLLSCGQKVIPQQFRALTVARNLLTDEQISHPLKRVQNDGAVAKPFNNTLN